MRGPQQDSLYRPQDQQQQQQLARAQDQPSKCASQDDPGGSTRQQQQQQQQQQPKDESRLARVKRALLGRAGGSSASHVGTSFGVELELADRHNETGVPLVVYRLCVYLEAHGFRQPALFRLTGGSSRLADRLRLSFEKRGDADLEAAGCPATAALLLRQYLKELPRPIVSPTCVSKMLQLHSHERVKSRECWIDKSRDLLVNELPVCERRLLGYLLRFLARFESQHGCASGVCGIFAPILLPHLPPATVLLRDLLQDAHLIFPDANGVKESTSKVGKETKDEFTDNSQHHKPPKRKDRRDSCGQERKLIRSNSEEKIWESGKRVTGDNSAANSADTIRRVSSHEDFNSAKHHHILSKLQKDIMGHGLRHGNLPLQERTNASPVSSKTSLIHSNEVVPVADKYDYDAERFKNSERFSRSITPRGRRQVRKRKPSRGFIFDQAASKENDKAESEPIFTISSDSNKANSQGSSFLEMFTGGPSRSPSPVRPPSLEQEDAYKPTLANWGFQVRQSINEEMDERAQNMVSPRNSVLVPRRFYEEEESEDQENLITAREYGLRSLMKQINSLKKKIKKYEGEFEESFGYRPSHSDKMSNRDIKKLVSELNRVRREHKILREGISSFLNQKFNHDDIISANNNNNGEEKFRSTTMTEMVKEVDRKLSDKRLKHSRPENMEDLTFEQLLDEKTAVQKALLHLENTFGRPVSKEDRNIVRPLYDKYRTLKRLLMRAGANRYNDSMSELATILEHETMDFSSSSGTPVDCERRASEPEMSHRGISDCIDSMEQTPTDSDSQHSSSDSGRGIVESLHSLPKDELLEQQRITKEEKKRLRRALKELEMQFEARAGRRMLRKDRGPQIDMIYDSYKQTKAKLRLITALLAKNAQQGM